MTGERELVQWKMSPGLLLWMATQWNTCRGTGQVTEYQANEAV